jgi:mannobiose 2-epimerase
MIGEVEIERLGGLAGRMRKELEGDILPFWLPYIDREGGGFYGLVRNDGSFDAGAPKGLVMHARFLWAYSAAYKRYAKPEYLEAARAAYAFLSGPLCDATGDGFWWGIDPAGKPSMAEKLVYGEAFAVYGLAEYYEASGDLSVLGLALKTWDLIDRAAFDSAQGGYAEACDRGFTRPVVLALSEVDIPCDKSMNTNLHVLEALANLYRVSRRPELLGRLRALSLVYAERVFRRDGTLALYFDRDWRSLTDHVSFGHDIESAWLLGEAADLAWPRARPAPVAAAIAAARENALAVLAANGGSMPYERVKGRLDGRRDWWVQAETAVGLVDAYAASGDGRFLEAAVREWDFIEARLVDRVHGEWFWGLDEAGVPDLSRPKGGLWKTAYHNGRACLEVMARHERLAAARPQANGAEGRG